MKSCAVFVFAFLFALGACGQHQTFTVDPNASTVNMTLNTTHEVVHGAFHVQSGAIEFDRGSPRMAGSVVVVAGSGKTGNDSRDKRMNKEILQVEHHGSVSFEPKSYAGAIAAEGDSNIQVTGIFTLLDTPHEITIPMQVHMGAGAATAKAHFAVPYIQWGLKDPSFFVWKADKEVSIDLMLAGQLSK